MAEGITTCPNCSNLVSTQQPRVEKTATIELERKGKHHRVIYAVLAAIVFALFFVAANRLSEGGAEMMKIQSVGGRTLEEAYYLQLGSVYAGYAHIARGMGIFFASVLVWLGFRR